MSEANGSRRPLVPTEREARLGLRPAPPETARPAASEDVPKRRTVRALLADLDPRSIGGPRLPLLLLGLAAFFTAWDDQALGILLPEMQAEFAFSLQFLLTLTSVLGIVSTLMAPAVGYLADRVKRVWLLRIGGLAANLGSIVTGLAGGVPQLVAGRAMSGIGDAAVRPAGFPLLTDYYPSRSRARVFASLGVMGGIGALVGPAVAGNLGESFGWRTAVVSLGVLATVVTVAYFFLREPPRGYIDRLESGADPEAAAREQDAVGWAEAWRAAGSITTLRRLWYATPFLEVAGAGTAMFLALYYAEVFGLGPRARGYIATGNGLAALVALIVAAPIADRLLATRPSRVMVILGALMALYAGAVVVLALSPSLWLSILVSLPFSFGFVALTPALYTLLSLIVPARIRGLGMQTIAPWRLVAFVALPFLGRAADAWGLRQGLLVLVPLFLVGAVILATSAWGVERDIRAAKAASMADEVVRRARAEGRGKLLVVRDLDVQHGAARVLSHVDLDIEEGEIVALVGTNGAGKSTLLHALAGLHPASNGAVFLDGRDITHVPAHRNAASGVVIVPGGRSVFPALSVEENLRAATWLRRDGAGDAPAIDEALAMFPVLRERLATPAGNLSGGEQQMLGLAQAFLMEPRLLAIDELSLGLAPAVVEQLLEALRRLRERGVTILLVEQSLNVALTIAGRAVFMERGEIRFDGPTRELLGRPELVRAVLMGGSAAAAAPRGGGAGRATSREPVLTVEDLGVRFGGVQALAGVSLSVAPGEIVGIVGANGAGKTTLFDAICGFVRPDGGRVLLDGADATGAPPHVLARLGLARSFQNARLFPALTVRENVAVAFERRLPPRNPLVAAWSPRDRRNERRSLRRAERLIAALNLAPHADKFVDELSTGLRRAVEIACMTAAEPRVLLLDEPSSGLAQAETEALGPVIAGLVRETGCAVLVVEHDVPFLTGIADRLVAMELGRVVTEGAPEDVLRDPRVLASYLAASAEVVGRSGDLAASAEVAARFGELAKTAHTAETETDAITASSKNEG